MLQNGLNVRKKAIKDKTPIYQTAKQLRSETQKDTNDATRDNEGFY